MSTVTDPKALPVRMLPLLAPNLGWVAVYAGAWVWYLLRHDLPDLFAAVFLYDLVVNMVTPWVLVPGMLLFAMWAGRSEIRGVRMIVGCAFMAAMCGLFIWVSVAVLHHHGGWWLVVVVPVLASKLSWRSLAGGPDRGVGLLLIRSMLAPLFCFAPALIICCVVYQRQTLGLENADYVGLFGVIYFGGQAALDYLLAIGRQGKGPLAPSRK